MGQAKQRKQNDPNYGTETNDPNLKNVFFVRNLDGEHMLVVNTKMANQGFISPDGSNVSDIFYSSSMELVFRNICGNPKGFAFCWVEKHPELDIGDWFCGTLEECPKIASSQRRFTRFKTVQKINKNV